MNPQDPQATPLNKELIPITENGMQLTNFDQLWRVATLLHKSGLVSLSFKTPEQLMVALLRSIELKLPPLQAIEGMSVINNRVGLMGDLALSMVEASGLLEEKKVTYSQQDELTCTVTLQRKGRKARDYSFSVKEAKMAGIYDRGSDRNSVWRSYPKRMTYYRALGFGLRDEFSDILKGIKTLEELQDYPDTSQPAYVSEDFDDEGKIATNQGKEAELVKAAQAKGDAKIVNQKKDPVPSPAEAAEPAFEEDKPKGPAFSEKLAQDFPEGVDELDMSPPSEDLSWKTHVIRGIKSFAGRTVESLIPTEVTLLETRWVPAAHKQINKATQLELDDLKAIEARIAHDKVAKPW